jgi:hypothetical protein
MEVLMLFFGKGMNAKLIQVLLSRRRWQICDEYTEIVILAQE